MSLHPPHEKEQLRAIEIQLDKAPKIQEDLKEELGYEKNKFFNLDLFEYRINNSLLDIAEDLDVKSLYGLTTDDVARTSVGSAFRGHHNEDFKPEYQFEGLFSEEMNDMIEEIRYEKNGRASVETHGDQMRNGGRASVETHGDQMRNGYANGLANLTSEELSELGRKGALASAEAQGNHVFSLEEIADIHNFREESFNHSSKYRPNSPNWNYTTSKMNEKYGGDWSTSKVKHAYRNNKDKLPEEEE